MANVNPNWTKTTVEYNGAILTLSVPPISKELLTVLESKVQKCTQCGSSNTTPMKSYTDWQERIELLEGVWALEKNEFTDLRHPEKGKSLLLLALAIGIIVGTCLGIKMALPLNKTWLTAIIGIGGFVLYGGVSSWSGYRGVESKRRRTYGHVSGSDGCGMDMPHLWLKNLFVGAFVGSYDVCFSKPVIGHLKDRLNYLSSDLPELKSRLEKLFSHHNNDMLRACKENAPTDKGNQSNEINNAYQYFVVDLPAQVSALL